MLDNAAGLAGLGFTVTSELAGMTSPRESLVVVCCVFVRLNFFLVFTVNLLQVFFNFFLNDDFEVFAFKVFDFEVFDFEVFAFEVLAFEMFSFEKFDFDNGGSTAFVFFESVH